MHHPYAPYKQGPVLIPEPNKPSADLILPPDSVIHPTSSGEKSEESSSSEESEKKVDKEKIETPESILVMVPLKDTTGQTIFAQVPLKVPSKMNEKPEEAEKKPDEEEASSESDSSSESESDERRDLRIQENKLKKTHKKPRDENNILSKMSKDDLKRIIETVYVVMKVAGTPGSLNDKIVSSLLPPDTTDTSMPPVVVEPLNRNPEEDAREVINNNLPPDQATIFAPGVSGTFIVNSIVSQLL
jgi:hypothetical protein